MQLEWGALQSFSATRASNAGNKIKDYIDIAIERRLCAIPEEHREMLRFSVFAARNAARGDGVNVIMRDCSNRIWRFFPYKTETSF